MANVPVVVLLEELFVAAVEVEEVDEEDVLVVEGPGGDVCELVVDVVDVVRSWKTAFEQLSNI
jgi:hypothetical protein